MAEKINLLQKLLYQGPQNWKIMLQKLKILLQDSFLPVNGAVFRFLRRLFLRLGQPFPDGGLFLTAYFPAGKLLKCRCDGIRIPAFEKDQVTGLLCGGVFLQGKIHMIFLRYTGESLDILVTDLDIGKAGVLAGKLFKTLPAAVDFGRLVFLDFRCV